MLRRPWRQFSDDKKTNIQIWRKLVSSLTFPPSIYELAKNELQYTSWVEDDYLADGVTPNPIAGEPAIAPTVNMFHERWQLELQGGRIQRAPPKLRHMLQGQGNRVDASVADARVAVPATPQGFQVADAQTGGLGETIPGFAITSPEGEVIQNRFYAGRLLEK